MRSNLVMTASANVVLMNVCSPQRETKNGILILWLDLSWILNQVPILIFEISKIRLE